MRHFLFAALLAFSFSSQIYGQSYTKQQETLPCLNKKFTIVAHIFKDSVGNYGVTEQNIIESVETMNRFFWSVQISVSR